MASDHGTIERTSRSFTPPQGLPTQIKRKDSDLQAESSKEDCHEIVLTVQDDDFQPPKFQARKENIQTSSSDDRMPLSPSGISEISRVLSVHTNYYAVLKVNKNATDAEIRNSFLRMSRAVHPDKCQDPAAHQATVVVNLAYTTLKNPIKRALYDRYVSDAGAKSVTYNEWEQQSAQKVQLPIWMQKLLSCPGGPVCITLLLLMLLPMALVVIVVAAAIVLLLLPVKGFIVLYQKGQEVLATRRRTRSYMGARVNIPYHRELGIPKVRAGSLPVVDLELTGVSERERVEAGAHSNRDGRLPTISPRKPSGSGQTQTGE